MSLPPKYDLEFRKRLNAFESKNAPKHPPVLYAIMFGVGGMVIIGATLILNGIDNEIQSVVGGFIIGGIVFLIQSQSEKNYYRQYEEEHYRVQKELINQAMLDDIRDKRMSEKEAYESKENLTIDQRLNIVKDNQKKEGLKN